MWAAGRRPRRGACGCTCPTRSWCWTRCCVPWLAEAGRFEEAEELMASVRRSSRGQLRIVQAGLAEVGALISIQIWQGQAAEVAGVMEVVRGRGAADGRRRRGHAVPRRAGGRGPRVRGRPTWSTSTRTTGSRCSTGAARPRPALVLGDRDLAAAAYERLAPYAGHSGCAGPAPPSGRSTPSWRRRRPPWATSSWPPGTPTRRCG